MITPDDLVEFGFKEYKVPQHDKHERVWQYLAKDALGKRFHVDIRFWKHSKYWPDCPDGWDARCQFNTHGEGKRTFEVTAFISDDDTPKSVVHFFQDVWFMMGCNYYERYEEPA